MITAQSKISDIASRIPNHRAIFGKYWKKKLDDSWLKYYGMLKIQFYADQDGWDQQKLDAFLRDCNEELAQLEA